MDDLQSIILIVAAGGLGTRLGDFTGGKPKALLEIAGRPLLSLSLEEVPITPSSHIVIVSQPKWMDSCIAVASDSFPNAHITGVYQPQPFGTLDALQRALIALQTKHNQPSLNRPIVFLLGDNVPAHHVIKLGLKNLSSYDAVFFSRQVTRPGTSAILVRDSAGNPKAFRRQKAEEEEASVEICGGLYIYTPLIGQKIPTYRRPTRLHDREWNVDWLNAQLLADKRVYIVQTVGTWIHINTTNDIEKANLLFKTHN